MNEFCLKENRDLHKIVKLEVWKMVVVLAPPAPPPWLLLLLLPVL
jgi:hypothetical protein